MATKTHVRLVIVLGALLCAAGLGIVIWTLRGYEPRAGSGAGSGEAAADADKQQDWRRVEVSIDDKTGVFEVGVFRSPIPFKPLPPAQTRRDTPLDAWVSFKSHAVAGDDADDLEELAGHYLDRDYLVGFVRDKVKLPADEYFQKLRSAENNSRAVGTVKYRDHVLLIYQFEGSGSFADRTYTVSACMVEQDGVYYIDERPKETDPVLKEVVDSDFKQLGF